MTRKTKGKAQPGTPSPATAAPPGKSNPHGLVISQNPDESERDAVGRNAIRATVGGAMTIKEYGSRYGDQLEVMGLVNALSDQAKAVEAGNLGRAEQMLIVQAHTLDTIFNTLARRAARNMDEYLDAAERFMRLALKAQSQCRATLETLALIKNPASIAFVRQANIAHGPQQVNNAPAPTGEASRARETENQQNRLLEAQHGERLDVGTAGAPSAANTDLEALGAIHRPKDTGR